MATQDYKGKWALVLGGSSGLGLATVLKLAKEGMHICVVHRTRRAGLTYFEEAMTSLKTTGTKVMSFNLDATKPESRESIINTISSEIGIGTFKVLVHSIAKGNLKPFFDRETQTLSNTDLHITLEAMAVSLYDWVSAFAKAELFSTQARVIAFTSEGSTKAWKNYGAVAAAKAALEAIIRNIALEFSTIGLTANAIQAGVTNTESLRLIPGSEKMKEYSKLRNPFNRLTTPEDVANAVFLLCQNEASWINGTTIPVDGGEHMC